MLCGGTFVVDHASGLIIIYNQVSLGTSDNIRSKERYEMKAHEFRITVESYRGDYSVYKTEGFVEDLKTRHQTMSLSGLGAHYQNSVAKRAIYTVIKLARTIMIYQILLWLEQFDMRL